MWNINFNIDTPGRQCPCCHGEITHSKNCELLARSVNYGLDRLSVKEAAALGRDCEAALKRLSKLNQAPAGGLLRSVLNAIRRRFP